MKKEVIVILFLIFSIINSINAIADEVGCCSNPAAGVVTCTQDRLVLRDRECCPTPEKDYPSYYKSSQNPFGPSTYNDCVTNFFALRQSCSGVSACALGCCCSELGGEIKSEAQCKATGLTFHKAQTNCNQVCPNPQCNDGLDNDNNGCADFEGGDLGCTNSADTTESGGSCAREGAGCSDANYMPKLSNLEITPAKGERKFLLRWRDECSATAVSYDILRCKNSNCTNFALIGTTNTNSFEDVFEDLLFDTVYTYQIKARYNLQAATPTITKPARLGNLECFGQTSSDNFCIHESYYEQYKEYLITNFPTEFSNNFSNAVKNKFKSRFNKAFFCDSFNNLVPQGTSCPSDQVCVVTNNKPSCLAKSNCNYNSANPFGLYYTLTDCEKDKYCFYDRSHSSINSCFSCDTSMACYDYRTEAACKRDNCKIGNCKWKNLASQIGIGVCVSTNAYNCQWCEKRGTPTLENSRAFNEVYDFCTKEKSNALSEGAFKCYLRAAKSKNCGEVVCTDYGAEQCSDAQITHDDNNKVINPSQDACGIKVCQNINNICVKNADGDDKADCDSATCERDYFAPNTTMLPIIKRGKYDSLITQIYDRTSINSSVILKTSGDYNTFLCVEPCGSGGHPYNISTASRTIILSNLDAFDGTNGNRLLVFKEGTNVIRYYSQDPAKNIGEVKKITIEAHSNADGPKVLGINVTDGVKVLDKIFTNNQKPIIDVHFFEPAIVTHSRLVNKKTGFVLTLQGNTQPAAKVSFQITQTLPNGEYTFELNAKNNKNIFMDTPLSQIIVIDNSKPTLTITPSNGTVFNASLVNITLLFDKEVNIEIIKINSNDVKSMFSTNDNKVFTATIELSDGNKNLKVVAKDFAKNQVEGYILFIVNANPTTINLINPKFGTSSKYTFNLTVETDNNALCKFSLDDNLEFEFMDAFIITRGTLHTVPNFNKINNGDTRTHKLIVGCDDKSHGIAFKSFDINVDTSPPSLKNAFAFPNPVVEKPSTTTLTIEADEPVICKFSSASKEFDDMEGRFDNFDNNTFQIINKKAITVENEGSYLYYAGCKNKAELNSATKEISFKVDLTIPISIISHTPEYFNSTNVVLAIETNKKSQCKFSEADTTAQNGELFGASGYSHTRQLAAIPGKHTFYIVCKDQYLQKFSDVASVAFTVDITPPIILSVDDSSTLPNPEFTWSTDNLRVKWSSIDNESRVSFHSYSIIESGTLNEIVNWTTSYANNEWVSVLKQNGSSLNLINNNNYFFRIKANNVVGLVSDISESDGVTVDTSLKPLNCTNGIKDETETDVDCGGGCDLCNLGKNCSINSDCKSNFCNDGLCSAPRCDDNIKNQEESDTDCGGSCKKCQNDQGCKSDNDCESSYCIFDFCKPQESCSDSEFSPGESDVDCGGHCPTKCYEGRNCNTNEDCGEQLQCISSTCKACAEDDTNCNGVPDDQEEKGVKDGDNDGLPDEWEIQNDLDPNDPNDAGLDSDKDGLTNLEEFNVQKTYGKSTDPNLADTDNDGFSDKEEIEKGTSPVDIKDFPKSKIGTTILFILGIIVLISGFGYLAYKVIAKRREEQFELPRQREMPRAIPQRPVKPILIKPPAKEISVGEALKRKEEQKEKEREKLFETFEKERKSKEEAKDIKAEKPESKKVPKRKRKIQLKKSKEDVFLKLQEIAKEGQKRKLAKHKKTQK